MLEALNARFKQVAEEMKNVKSQMELLKEQLDKTTIHYHVVSGRHNELAFQINEASKPVEQANGETYQQSEEQAA